MAGVELGQGNKGRSVNQEVNMIPFIDLLMVTIAFLLITAVWVSFSRIETNAMHPGVDPGPHVAHPGKDLHLFITPSELTLSWRQGSTTVSETRMPRQAGDERLQDLAAQIEKEWKLHGSHQDPSDRAQDRCVLHTDNSLPFKQMVAVMDAVHSARRKLAVGEEEASIPALSLAFASR